MTHIDRLFSGLNIYSTKFLRAAP